MNDSWDDRKRAQEEQYFEKVNKEALERLKQRSAPRLSPINGEPMEQVTMMGVTVDRCKKSGGIWLDAGELEALMDASQATGSESSGALSKLFASLFQK
jgi:Zn-finger nucleic acid-binding protein